MCLWISTEAPVFLLKDSQVKNWFSIGQRCKQQMLCQLDSRYNSRNPRIGGRKRLCLSLFCSIALKYKSNLAESLLRESWNTRPRFSFSDSFPKSGILSRTAAFFFSGCIVPEIFYPVGCSSHKFCFYARWRCILPRPFKDWLTDSAW